MAVSLVISHVVTSMFLRGLCGYLWFNTNVVFFNHTNGGYGQLAYTYIEFLQSRLPHRSAVILVSEIRQ